MGFYDDPANVKQYLTMCQDYDGTDLYQRLSQHLPDHSTLLEVGSGGGLDLEYLKQHFLVTGSDLSDAFLDVLKARHPDIDFLKLNAQSFSIPKKFDCIFSNKVLHHLTKPQLAQSFELQAKHLQPGGVLAHSFWLGDQSEEMNGLLFTYYQASELLALLSPKFEIVDTHVYEEFEADDSIFVIAKLRES
ncbi:class I SAM-dependent methyltransferase [Reinekea forsetii]|nr:class I SAM-dependent methyltransferase [Reinekea forsetii]